MEPKEHPVADARNAVRSFSAWTQAKVSRFAGRSFSFARHKLRILGGACGRLLKEVAQEAVHAADQLRARRSRSAQPGSPKAPSAGDEKDTARR